MRKHRMIVAGLMLALGLSMAGSVWPQSIEDKLRTQLRSTTQELRQLQDSQAQLQADKTAAEQQRDKALADLKQAQAELVAAKGKSSAQMAAERALAAEKASHALDTQQLAKYRSAFEELRTLSGSHEAERTRAQTELKAREAQLQMCEVKNAQLYQVGQEILKSYEHMGFGTFLSSREPFAQRARVKYDEIAQHYGDALYAGKFDRAQRAAPATPVTSSGAEATSPESKQAESANH